MSSGVETSLNTSALKKTRETGSADKIIVALDVATAKEAMSLVNQLREKFSFFKIGLQLYSSEGPDIVRAVREAGAKVFLDLKLHDIPNTVAKAVEAAARLDPQMLTIHLSGGREMIQAAAKAAPESTRILGVTVLTSSTEKTLDETGVPGTVADQVLRLARLGFENGLTGMVTSAREVKVLRGEFGDRIKIVVPGLRPSGADAGDQKRVMTPREAIEGGADYLVIGRPITGAPDPSEAAVRILNEIQA